VPKGADVIDVALFDVVQQSAAAVIVVAVAAFAVVIGLSTAASP
jgi:hypothetical protein